MPCRVNVVHRVIRRIRVQVLRPRAVRVSAYRILLEEAPCVRVVMPAGQIVQPIAVLHRACELHFVLDRGCRRGAAAVVLAERVIDVVFRPV